MSTGAGSPTIRPYTPTRTPGPVLMARTVGRDAVLELIRRRVHSAATSRNRAHTLLVGPRGSGKSHVLEVVLWRLQQEPETAARFVVARVPEDAIGVTRIDDLLDVVIGALGGPMERPRGRSVAERRALIAQHLQGRVVLLVIENLDRVFRALGLPGQRDLRSWVESTGDVLVLATSPLLFPGFTERDQPWFGGLNVSHLDDLGPADGGELLRRVAAEKGDAALVEFLRSEQGLARAQAVAALTGGSPRVWTILSECVSAESLDELVPAVHDLLEGLVPYYQQLLWELPGNEQRLIAALAEANRAVGVGELAHLAELDQQTTSSTLKRLVANRWVRREKLADGDGRRVFYRVREPMLRHHLQYRSGDHAPLAVIVELLGAWFDPHTRQAKLAAAPFESETMRLLAATFASEPHRSDSAYNNRAVAELRAHARRWLAGEDPQTRGRSVGELVERCIVEATESAVSASHVDASLMADRVGVALRQAAATPTRDGQVLELISACWDGRDAPATARDRLSALHSILDANDPLDLGVRDELAYWTGEAGDPAAARDQVTALLPDRVRVLGVDHPDTLTARHSLAYWTGEAGDPAAALSMAIALVADPGLKKAPRLGLATANITWYLARTVARDPSIQPAGDPMAVNLVLAMRGAEEAGLRLPAELLDLVRLEADLANVE